MRMKLKPTPRPLEHRVISRFAWLPIWCLDEMRWLERVKIHQVFVSGVGRWLNAAFEAPDGPAFEPPIVAFKGDRHRPLDVIRHRAMVGLKESQLLEADLDSQARRMWFSSTV